MPDIDRDEELTEKEPSKFSRFIRGITIMQWIIVGAALIVGIWTVRAMGNAIDFARSVRNEIRSVHTTAQGAVKDIGSWYKFANKVYDDRGKAREAARESRQERLRTIENYAALFAPATPKVQWASEVHTGAPATAQVEQFEKICADVDKFWEMNRALKDLKPGSGSGVSWQDLGVAKDDAMLAYRQTAATAARGLLMTLPLARKDRAEKRCGVVQYVQPIAVGDQIVSITTAAGLEPKHIGLQTAMQVRQWVIYAIRKDLVEVRGSQDQLAGLLMPIKGSGWKFTAAELALTADEAKMIELEKKEEKKQG